MNTLTLKATSRKVLGKKTRFLRRNGITPAHLFGHKIESLSLECKTDELREVASQAGMTTLLNLKVDAEKTPRKVLIREIQKDALGKELLHVDFYQIQKSEKIKADIPIVLTGEAPALKSKGRLLVHPLSMLSIECLPDNLPHEITVDIGVLTDVDQAIHVGDLRLGQGITVHQDAGELIVKVSEKTIAKTAEEEAESAAAGEAGAAEAGAA